MSKTAIQKAASKMGKRGAARRNQVLSKEERQAIGLHAIQTRWKRQREREAIPEPEEQALEK